MSLSPFINLTYNKNCVLNTLGMQPLFYQENEYGFKYIDNGKLFAVIREQNKQCPGGKCRILSSYFDANSSGKVFYNSFEEQSIDNNVVYTLLNNSDHFGLSETIEEALKDTKKLKERILFQLTYIQYRTTINKGNFIISSNSELLSRLCYPFTQIKELKKYTVSDDILPRNIVILGARELNNFVNPIVACPLINQKSFEEYCYDNDYYLEENPDKTKAFPMIETYLDKYEIYQDYIDNNKIDRWYIHRFDNKRTKSPYITIEFKK